MLCAADSARTGNPDINLLLDFWPARLEQAGVGWGRAGRGGYGFKYESDSGENAWFGSLRCTRRPKRYILVC